MTDESTIDLLPQNRDALDAAAEEYRTARIQGSGDELSARVKHLVELVELADALMLLVLDRPSPPKPANYRELVRAAKAAFAGPAVRPDSADAALTRVVDAVLVAVGTAAQAQLDDHDKMRQPWVEATMHISYDVLGLMYEPAEVLADAIRRLKEMVDQEFKTRPAWKPGWPDMITITCRQQAIPMGGPKGPLP